MEMNPYVAGVVLESNDKEKGHDFNSCAGVFCSPDVCTAETLGSTLSACLRAGIAANHF